MKCRVENNTIAACDDLNNLTIRHPELKVDSFNVCPFCGVEYVRCDKNDPWLYTGAIIEIRESKHDWRITYYRGQNLGSKEYRVRNTPWEFVPKCLKKIQINKNGDVVYCINNRGIILQKNVRWPGCPDHLKAKNDNDRTNYKRPEWIKYLQKDE